MSTRKPDRDHTIDEMLRRSASRGPVGGGVSDHHLDPETLAAWIDGDLSAPDVRTAEAHVSSCARCQAMVAAIVRTTPATPALVPWWRRGWAIGALVPLTAGAVAIAIWVATPEVELNKAPAVAARQTPAAAVAPPPQESQLASRPQEPSSMPGQPAAPPPPSSRERVVPQTTQARAKVDVQRKDAAELEGLKQTASNEMRREQAARATAAAAAAPPPAPAPPSAPASNAAALEAQAPATRRDAAAPAPLRETMLAKSAFVRAPTEIVSPDQSVRWRPGAAGSIQRSTDQGATWTALSSGVTDELTAGAAPSSTVCWLVGRRGTVLLTIDGVQWRRITFPESVDLVAVQATDLANATVTTADGRRFRTADGGQIWTRQ